MRIELINCEGAVLKCTVNRFGISLLAFLLDGKGYIKFTPSLADLYKYLLGHLTLESILEAAEEIKINNVIYDFKEIDLSNIHSLDKKITDHSEQDLDIRNMAKLIAKVESILYNRNSSDKLGMSTSRMTHYSTSPVLRSVIKSIKEMDTVKLSTLLDEDAEYMGNPMYMFLASLRDMFKAFEKQGDTSLYAQEIKQDNCPLNSFVFRFKGNKSKMEFNLEFRFKSKNLIKILEYKN
jgi:hypothetical protein